MSLNKLFNYASLAVPMLRDVLNSPQRLNRNIQNNIDLQRQEYGSENSLLSTKSLAIVIQAPISALQVSVGGILGVATEGMLTGSGPVLEWD